MTKSSTGFENDKANKTAETKSMGGGMHGEHKLKQEWALANQPKCNALNTYLWTYSKIAMLGPSDHESANSLCDEKKEKEVSSICFSL